MRADAQAGLLLVGRGLLERAQWKRVLKLDRAEAAIAAGTFVATLTMSLETAILGGADLWDAELRQRREFGGALFFDRPRNQVLNTWQRIGFDQRIGADHIFDSKRQALARIAERLDPLICAGCPGRIFGECRARPGPPPAADGLSEAAVRAP